MKRLPRIIVLLVIAAGLAACSAPAGMEQSPPPPQAASPSPVQSVSPVEAETDLSSYSPSPSPSFSVPDDLDDVETPPLQYKQPSKDTVIIANSEGYIIGGYSDGKWLTHIEAAAYCGQPMKFYQYSLEGQTATQNSSGISVDGSDLSPSSGTISAEYDTDSDTGYVLGIEVNDSSNYMFSAKPGRFPQIRTLSDISNVRKAVEKRINKKFKKGKVKAQINKAVSADVDGDRENEIIFNAGNTQGEDDYFENIRRNWYSLSGFIDKDGSLHIIQEYYSTGYAEDSGSVCISSITDIDGDGTCEFITELEGYEAWATIVYKYNSKEFKQVLWYETSI